jgi:hypothetical protein
VGTERVRRYPEQVLVAADPPSHSLVHGRHSTRPADSVEVMMTAPATREVDASGKGASTDVPPPVTENQKRKARQPLEKPENLVGTSNVPARPKPVQ